MKLEQMPFNIWLIMPDAKAVSLMRPVTVLDTFDSSGSSFHPNGLFSSEIFGRIGSKERDQNFSYINLNTTIIHPEIFMILRRLKSLYAGIISGKRYAVWDETEKDFIPATPQEGDTGYHFFVSHFREIEFKRNSSDLRTERIKVVEKYRENPYLSRYLVSPAGLRDLQINESGHQEEDEINDLYRRLLMTSSTIAATEENKNSPNLDTARWALQLTSNKIQTLIKTTLSGKRGWLLGKVARHNIMYGTASVITAMNPNALDTSSEFALSILDTQIGLLQALKATGPIAVYEIMHGYLGQIIGDGSSDVYLTNKKTLRKELATLSADSLDLYTTVSGIEKLINRFFEKDLRWETVTIDGYWLGLVYNDGKEIKFFNDISDLPESRDPAFVKPITFAELLYMSVYQRFKKLAGYITRFPVLGSRSTYPSNIRVRTTSKSLLLRALDETWEPLPEEYNIPAYPYQNGTDWLDSIVPHVSRLDGLGADFDGDRVVCNIFFSDNAYDEVQQFFKKKTSYVSPEGFVYQSCASIDTIKLLVHNLTGDPIDFGDDE